MPRSAARCGSQLDPELVGNGEDVLVAAAAHVHHDQMVARQCRRDLCDMSQRMGWLERGNDAFVPTRTLNRLARLAVGDRDILHATEFMQPGVFRADAGMIKTGGNRMRVVNLPVLVL